MPRTISTDTRWLERHGGVWRVTIAVPRDLHATLGTRLKRSLRTDSLAVANRLKLQAVHELRAEIENAREIAGGRPRAVIREALELAAYRRRAVDDGEHDEISKAVLEREAAILEAGAREVQDPETGEWHAIYRPEQVALAADFSAVASGTATPLLLHHATFLEKSQVKRRTKADDVRAVNYLLAWCKTKRVPPTVEAINRKMAVRFMDDFHSLSGGLAPASQNKYFNRLSRYWAFLVRREIVEINPWVGVSVDVPATKHNQQERAFTDEEVRILLTGPAPDKLRDVILIGALTGARLDAVVDLKVKDTVDGAFTFKPQKSEPAARDVPIHPALVDLVARRSKGKAPDDDLFPEWPGPKKAGSLRERSFKTSNAFTDYRRDVGVDQQVPGKRRALVNFHSFRRWFITKAERAGYSGDLIAAIVGHKRSGLTLGRYSEGPEMRQARKCVAAVKLPPLDKGPVPEVRAITPRR